MTLSVLMVNFNGKQFLRECLMSLKKWITVDHEIIIVDNASTDGSANYVKNNFPGIHLIESRENLGFAGANNLAAKNAAGTYLLLLNTDVVLLNDIIPGLAILKKNRNVGIVGAKMYGAQGEYKFSAGHFPSPQRMLKLSNLYQRSGFWKTGKFPSDSDGHGYPVDWVEGSFLLTCRFLWTELDGLDDGYFMYGEDIDYCRRARNRGFSTLYCPDVYYLHYGGFTIDRFPLVVKGLKRYHQKFSGSVLRILAMAVLNAGVMTRLMIWGMLFFVTRNALYYRLYSACRNALAPADRGPIFR